MRDEKKIVIDIDTEGNCSIDGQGFLGAECAHFIGEIEEALGDVVFQQDKEEYYQREETRERDTQCGGR